MGLGDAGKELLRTERTIGEAGVEKIW